MATLFTSLSVLTFWEDFVKSPSATILIPSFVAIFSIVLTNLVQGIVERKRKNEALDELFHHFTFQTSTICTAATDLAANLNEVAAKLERKEVAGYNMKLVPNIDPGLIAEWKTREFYYAITKRRGRGDEDKRKLAAYSENLRSCLNGFGQSEKLMMDAFGKYDSSESRNTEKFNEAYTEFVNTLFYHLENHKVSDDLVHALKKVYDDWHDEGGNMEMSHLYDSLIQPSLDICLDSRDEKVYALRNHLTLATQAYFHIKNLKEEHSQNFRSIAKRLIEDRDRLNELLANIAGYPAKLAVCE